MSPRCAIHPSMSITLEVLINDQHRLTVFRARDTGSLHPALSGWNPPAGTTRIEVRSGRFLYLTVFPDGDDAPPDWHRQTRDILASVTASSFLTTATSLKGHASWNSLLPADPLISLAADLFGAEKLSLLRACAPTSRALPGDWAPAALVRAVAHELTKERLWGMLSPDHEGGEHYARSLLERLPSAEDTLAHMASRDWMLAERARLLLVARGWLEPLDAT